MSFPYPRLLGGVLLLVLTAPLPAQVLERVVPAAFGPGALLRLEGEGLEAAREATFLAAAGDDLRVLRRPLLRGPQGEVLVVAPSFGDDGALPDGPWAWLAVDGAPPRPVFLFEGAGGLVRAAGSGSQVADGRRLTIAFDLAGGPPVPGNEGFTLELLGAPPGATAFALVAPARDTPWPRVGDATLVTAEAGLVLGPVVVGAEGRARLALPVPARAGAALAVQWLVHAPPARKPLFSDALRVQT